MTCKDVVSLSPLYLSGELDPVRRAEFGSHLDACPSCARELKEQRYLDERLRAAMLEESVQTAEMDRHIREVIRREYIRRFSAAAGIAVALIAGVISYRALTLDSKVYSAAAADHRREVVEGQNRRWVSGNTAIEVLAAEQGVSASGIHAPETAGYRLQRAKLCRLNGVVFLHLVYANDVKECSIFLRRREPGPISEPAYATDHNREHLASFRTKGLTAVVVTEQSRDVALQLAELTARAL